jgi:hypothetical protein
MLRHLAGFKNWLRSVGGVTGLGVWANRRKEKPIKKTEKMYLVMDALIFNN